MVDSTATANAAICVGRVYRIHLFTISGVWWLVTRVLMAFKSHKMRFIIRWNEWKGETDLFGIQLKYLNIVYQSYSPPIRCNSPMFQIRWIRWGLFQRMKPWEKIRVLWLGYQPSRHREIRPQEQRWEGQAIQPLAAMTRNSWKGRSNGKFSYHTGKFEFLSCTESSPFSLFGNGYINFQKRKEICGAI